MFIRIRQSEPAYFILQKLQQIFFTGKPILSLANLVLWLLRGDAHSGDIDFCYIALLDIYSKRLSERRGWPWINDDFS